MPVAHWLQLSLTKGLGPITIGRLVERFGNAQAVCATSAEQLRTIEGIGDTKSRELVNEIRSAGRAAAIEFERAAVSNATIICREDETFPPLLREIPDPPAVLYVRGHIEPRDLHSVAIVGSRKCSFYGREQAERFGALLAGAGVCVLSGGAAGVDAAAHRGALSHPDGRTIAVLGSGVDIAYPPENASLFDQIVQRGGAVISEYPMGAPPRRENFPRRNRIISGMSRGVLVIEAAERSGALITARQACDDHGRPVFALPGRVDNLLSAGPHMLIRDGATLVTQLQDILDELGPLPQSAIVPSVNDAPLFEDKPEPPAISPTLSDEQRAIVDVLEREPIDTDAIIDRSMLPAHIVMQSLTFLTLKGIVRRIDGRYAKRGKD